MRVVWICEYPLDETGLDSAVYRKVKHTHPIPWIVGLSKTIGRECPEIEMHVVAQSRLIKHDLACEESGIHFHILRDASAIPFTLRGWPPYFPAHLFVRSWFSRRRIVKTVKALKPDVVHVHGTEYCYGVAALESGFPFVVSMQGLIKRLRENCPLNFSDVHKYIGYVLREPLERRVVENGRYFIAKTPFDRKFVEQSNPEAKIFDVEEMMRPEFFKVQADYRLHRRVLFVGTFLIEKGARELFAAVAKLEGVTLVIASSHRPLMDELCRKYPAVPVERLGFLTAEKIAEEMQRVDMLVLPSYMDTSPNVVSEAMCAGLPVVATKVGGIPDMVDDGRTGLLVPARDADALANAISSLLEDDDLRKNMGQAARKEAIGRFSPEVAMNKVVDVYKQIVENENAQLL